MQDVLHCAEEELEEGSFEDNGAQLIGTIHFQELPSLIEILAKMIRIVNILTMMMMVGIMKMMRRWRKRKTMMMRMRMKWRTLLRLNMYGGLLCLLISLSPRLRAPV